MIRLIRLNNYRIDSNNNDLFFHTCTPLTSERHIHEKKNTTVIRVEKRGKNFIEVVKISISNNCKIILIR